jgi:cardiolipin synthase
VVRGGTFPEELRALEEEYRAHSHELTLDEWRSRPLHRRVLDSVARLTAAAQ